jgi:hypothetical protein
LLLSFAGAANDWENEEITGINKAIPHASVFYNPGNKNIKLLNLEDKLQALEI